MVTGNDLASKIQFEDKKDFYEYFMEISQTHVRNTSMFYLSELSDFTQSLSAGLLSVQ